MILIFIFDREWRKKWLKAQELTAREKAYHFFYHWENPDFRKARLNPLRRIWQVPYQYILNIVSYYLSLITQVSYASKLWLDS